MANVNLVVKIEGKGRIEEVNECTVEGQKVELSRTSSSVFEATQTIDVIGLVRYSTAITADSGTEWTLTIKRPDGKSISENNTVANGTIISVIANVGEFK